MMYIGTHYIAYLRTTINYKDNFHFLELETMIIIRVYKVKTLYGPPVNESCDNISRYNSVGTYV